MCSGVWGDMYDGHWVGVEGIRIVTFGRKELIESGFLGVGIMGSHHCRHSASSVSVIFLYWNIVLMLTVQSL